MNNSKNRKTIVTLRINKLNGRMLRLSAKKKNRSILLLYGQHASLERMTGIAEVLNDYGEVIIPDLPGFGGMDSFYKIGLRPTLDNFADYLASFIKLKYKNRKVTIVAMSFSFLIVTRMLQKYPELTKKVDLLISSVGFLHKDDFHVPRKLKFAWSTATVLFGGRIGSKVATYTILRPRNIRFFYSTVASKHPKLMGASKAEQAKRVDFEIKLWQINDFRTRMKTLKAMLRADLCQQKVNLPVYHISVRGDFYFNNYTVEQHMRVVYRDYVSLPTTLPAHMPSIVATKEDADPFIPQKLRELLK